MEVSIPLENIGKFIGKYSLGRDGGRGSLHFLRIKIPAGIINSKDLEEIAELSKEYGRGYAEITDRQDIQLHWIDSEKAIEIFEKLYKLGYTTDLCGQGFTTAGYGDVRNIVTCPLSGKISKDVAKISIKLTKYFSGNPEFIDLPRKFKIAFTACGYDCVRAYINDLGMIGVDDGFTALVGGSIGSSYPGATIAKHLPVFIPEKDVFEFVKAVVEIHRDYSSRESKNKARFKNLVNSWGIEKLLKEIEERIGKLERFESLDLKPKAHIGVGEQNDGKYYFTLPIVGGVLSDEKLRVIASIAKDYGSGEVRLTPEQNVIFVDVDDKDGIRKELEKHFTIYDKESYYLSIACPSDFCGKTKDVHSKDLLKRLLTVDGDLRIGISGCRNACGCHNVFDVGFVGKLVKKGGKIVQVYDMFIGGDSKLAMKYKENLSPDEAVEEFKKLVNNYRNFKASGKSFEEFMRWYCGVET